MLQPADPAFVDLLTAKLPPDTLGSQLEALVESQAAEVDYHIKLQVLRLDKLWPSLRSQVPPT